jgi:hypothetical protein
MKPPRMKNDDPAETICRGGVACCVSARVIPREDLGRFLIDPDYVSSRVAESGSNLGSIHAQWLHHLASVREDQVQGDRNAVDHDVNE